jgi:general stress protein 26
VTLAELPAEVLAVLREFRCCEMATVGPDGTPVAWPMVPLLLLDRAQLLLTTSIGFAAKAANVRREPRVSMLFSDPTGSGLSDPPAVLVSGTASVGERVETAATISRRTGGWSVPGSR